MCAKEQTSGIETLFGVQILTVDFLITVLISDAPPGIHEGPSRICHICFFFRFWSSSGDKTISCTIVNGFVDKIPWRNTCDGQGCPLLWSAHNFKEHKLLLEKVCYLRKIRTHQIYSFYLLLLGDRGSTVVKLLCYKSEGRWFDPSWCQWNFSLK